MNTVQPTGDDDKVSSSNHCDWHLHEDGEEECGEHGGISFDGSWPLSHKCKQKMKKITETKTTKKGRTQFKKSRKQK